MSSQVLLIGRPNTGKSLLFNKITGLTQKVANFPGATVATKRGSFDGLEIIDFPGIYSLNPLTKDEDIAVNELTKALTSQEQKGIVCVLDITKLSQGIKLALSILHKAQTANVPVVFALNMKDELAQIPSIELINELEKELRVPVITLSAKTGEGIEQLKHKIKHMAQGPQSFLPHGHQDISEERLQELSDKISISSENYKNTQKKLDSFFLSKSLGAICFLAIMLVLFQSIFTWASPLMDSIEGLIEWSSSLILPHLSEGMTKNIVSDVIFGGLGSFLVFVPQIVVLTFVIGILEDSGYLVRAAIICHRPLSFFGLSGKSFIPYLSGHACAIPAIMAARTIESPKKRLITMLTVPFMSCSARLPVYALLVSVLIPDTTVLGGLIGLQGIAFFGLYFLGIFFAIIVSSILSKTVFKDRSDTPFISEMPPYRIPSLSPLLRKALESGKQFIVKAGPIIFIVNMIIWALGTFPQGAGGLETSYMASLGKLISPLMEPLGLDWKYGVAILTSFLAREVFVGTLGTLFGMEAADENIMGLAGRIQESSLEFSSGMALLVFYVLALQCGATVAVLKKEAGGHKVAWSAFIGYTLLAYAMALLTKIIFSF